MYPEYFYLEQWYRWLRDAIPFIVVGLVLVMMALCCCAGIMLPESRKEGMNNDE